MNAARSSCCGGTLYAWHHIMALCSISDTNNPKALHDRVQDTHITATVCVLVASYAFVSL